MRSAVPPVRRVGSGVSYTDGAEDELLHIMAAAADRSSGSDELAAKIVDWPTRYHLSPQRVNLLRPLQVPAGCRVLDVGAGTGSIARYLGEQGAHVVALEGNASRAQVAAARCEDLPNVEVLSGALHELAAGERFDLVLLIGVLEYAGAPIGGAGGAPAMLDVAQRHLNDDGALVLAIENQFGLKYLLGAAEDHLGRPWVGLDDYPGPPGVRTWSRRELAGMVEAAGLVAQTWIFPYPDYKLPATLLHERLFDEPDADRLVDQLVLQPVATLDREPARLADASAAHAALVRAGLGPDVASSFLVVAARRADPVESLVQPGVLAWLSGRPRRHPWRRQRVLTVDRLVVPTEGPGERSVGWLHQVESGPRPFEDGETLGQQALAAVRHHDRERLAAVLGRWRDEHDRRAVPVEHGTPRCPFLPGWSVEGLPDGYLDVSLSNFVDRPDGLVLIDDEWRLGTPVDLEIARYRALWVLAREIVSRGIEHEWGETATVADVVGDLHELAGLVSSERAIDAFREAEAALQELVAGEPPERVRSGWLDGSLTGLDLRADRRADVERDDLRARLISAEASLAEARDRAQWLADQREEFIGQREHLSGVVAAKDAEIAGLHTLRGFAGAWARRVRARFRPR